ncbi:MAG: TIGR04283 family arsenosugar biosynthesis glycosyltransferase [Aquaticitalea sp.]
MNYQISIIIPILNEAETIGQLLTHLIGNSSAENISEIIVVDGGSTDGSKNVIKKLLTGRKIDEENQLSVEEEKFNLNLVFVDTKRNDRPQVHIVNSQKGRAKQMNTGAKHATGNILYFLHADSFPPNNFDRDVINEVQKGNEAGCFRMQFDSDHWWLRLASWLTQFRWRACRGGDQSQFITKKLFEDIGGFDESYIIYEDNVLINELFARKQFVVINKKLKTSARLYRKHGVWKLQYHFWTIYVKKWFGADSNELYAYYKKHLC